MKTLTQMDEHTKNAIEALKYGEERLGRPFHLCGHSQALCIIEFCGYYSDFDVLDDIATQTGIMLPDRPTREDVLVVMAELDSRKAFLPEAPWFDNRRTEKELKEAREQLAIRKGALQQFQELGHFELGYLLVHTTDRQIRRSLVQLLRRRHTIDMEEEAMAIEKLMQSEEEN